MTRVLPDAARQMIGLALDQIPSVRVGVNVSVKGPGAALVFTEVKARSGKVTLSRNDWKVKAMIDVLSVSRAGSGVPTLEIVGVKETEIADSVVAYATERGVLVAQRTAFYDDRKNEFQASAATLHNPEVIPSGFVELGYFSSPGNTVPFWE
jgi:hypothetical protein